MAIQSFSDATTEEFFISGHLKKKVGWRGIATVARRKLDLLHYATDLRDLRSPPGNRLESLKGDLKGWQSIRVNDRWRVLFHWAVAGPADVRIADYH